MKTNTYRKRHTGIPINKKQISIIKMACNHLQIDDGTYRDMLSERYSVTSCTKLTYDQAGALIRELEGKGFVLIPKAGGETRRPSTPRPSIPRGDNKVIAMVNVGEIDKINAIAALIQWRAENGLVLFLEKRMGIKGGKVRTSEQAYLAIEGLKKMFINGMKKQHGPAWWRMQFDDPRVMEFISIHCPEEWR